MNRTGITWTDLTWNPVTGCDKVSPGCRNCYAEALSKRWGRSFEVQHHRDRFNRVAKVPAGSKVFVNSMSDFFHADIPADVTTEIMAKMATRPDVTFQVLTKRPERIAEALSENADIWEGLRRHTWLGVSVESQLYLERYDVMMEAMADGVGYAQVCWISAEPLLGPLDLTKTQYVIDWVVIGGESGPGHRYMNPEWAREILRAANRQKSIGPPCAVWVKQLGGFWAGTPLEEIPEDLRIRDFPAIGRAP
jgi:protein gp37